MNNTPYNRINKPTGTQHTKPHKQTAEREHQPMALPYTEIQQKKNSTNQRKNTTPMQQLMKTKQNKSKPDPATTEDWADDSVGRTRDADGGTDDVRGIEAPTGNADDQRHRWAAHATQNCRQVVQMERDASGWCRRLWLIVPVCDGDGDAGQLW